MPLAFPATLRTAMTRRTGRAPTLPSAAAALHQSSRPSSRSMAGARAPGSALHRALPVGALAMVMLGTALSVDARADAQAAAHDAAAVAPAAAASAPHAPAGSDAARAASVRVPRSDMDAQLFYQVLVGELELREGQAGTAYQIILDAARRTGDEKLYQRAVEIALRGQAGEQALAAARAWRTASPQSRAAQEFTAQILLALGRPGEAVEPLRDLLRLTPTAQLPAALATVPRLFVRVPDRREAARHVDEITTPFRDQPGAPGVNAAAWAASGWAWLAAEDSERSLQALRNALAASPGDESAGLLAIELIKTQPAAEELLQAHLRAQPDNALVRLAYARRLIEAQRLPAAAQQLEAATRLRPDYAGAWLTLGAVRLDLKQPSQAEAALGQYLSLRQASRRAAAPAAAASASTPASAPSPGGSSASAPAAGGPASDDDGPDDTPTVRVVPDEALTAEQDAQAYLLMSQAAEMQGHLKEAQGWLDRVPQQSAGLVVQMRRASLLARQGKLDQGLALLQRTPVSGDAEERARYQAQSALLREARRWADAHTVLQQAIQRFPQDADLLYEQAMVAEKLDRYDEMEQLLRRIIEIDPKHQHAYNALGFSLADRGVRLQEARQLIAKALELAPGDAFITDSLGWVEFRLGHLDEARRLLTEAYRAKPDPEIAAHLGEVLWIQGERDEARRLWREGLQRDPANETLRSTLKRLKIHL